eukprot:scaffold42272_cov25-Prasinocladus_malaysianus.AAC.1
MGLGQDMPSSNDARAGGQVYFKTPTLAHPPVQPSVSPESHLIDAENELLLGDANPGTPEHQVSPRNENNLTPKRLPFPPEKIIIWKSRLHWVQTPRGFSSDYSRKANFISHANNTCTRLPFLSSK